jgi:hypothetical protein
MVDSVFDYSQSSPTQQMQTTAGTIFGAYNAITGYFQNVRKYKDDEAKFKSIMGANAFHQRHCFHIMFSLQFIGRIVMSEKIKKFEAFRLAGLRVF